MIFKNDQAIVTFDDQVPCVIWTPNGYIKGDNFREPFRVGIDFVEKKISTYPNITWLNDARQLKTVGRDDLNWLNENVNNRAYKLGVKKVAFVVPENIFGKWAVKFYVDFTNKRSDNSLDIRAFSSMGEAKNWLKVGKGVETSFI
ncbi:MAG: hypothetical protein JXA77_12250 [Bacteroidales bacterium]|nr:hypothetical protein [Bacteroidales bacterium]MBN2818562.1 hypothetical protein [Bacteroidales bacterium]